jgi:hypothetical protein
MDRETRYGCKVQPVVSKNLVTICNKCVFNNVECYSQHTAEQGVCTDTRREDGLNVYYIAIKNTGQGLSN